MSIEVENKLIFYDKNKVQELFTPLKKIAKGKWPLYRNIALGQRQKEEKFTSELKDEEILDLDKCYNLFEWMGRLQERNTDLTGRRVLKTKELCDLIGGEEIQMPLPGRYFLLEGQLWLNPKISADMYIPYVSEKRSIIILGNYTGGQEFEDCFFVTLPKEQKDTLRDYNKKTVNVIGKTTRGEKAYDSKSCLDEISILIQAIAIFKT